jgi:hypothetical protein
MVKPPTIIKGFLGLELPTAFVHVGLMGRSYV